ncbi:NAD+ synthetase [Pedobacter sp. L105]|uniref:HoxN/HupN/NixA family nickel/cobalt transporter n=1 Tax=Pedobacter sp. L105 TaxID=1641871 RepID=UPI00131B893A|nr:NAD+ synthetase [Pedobacter sp. L105]
MDIFQQNLTGFIILLVLGLRHGLDPDHITVIDGYTYRLHEKKSLWSRWVGTLFALGHGAMVIVIALSLSILKSKFNMPVWLDILVEWLPLVMLLMIGISNFISLTQKKQVKVTSFRKMLLPKYFNTHLNPFTVILTGIIFGFIFDTSSQIAAFGYAVSASNQLMYAVLGGVVFSVGLIMTGTCDSFLLSKLLKTFDQKKIQTHRFKLNVLITIMCFALPIYKVISYFYPKLELNTLQNNIVGLSFIAIIMSLYLDLYIRYRRSVKAEVI